MGTTRSQALYGLQVNIDNLAYEFNAANLPDYPPHAFAYFITITNNTEYTVTLLGRKWIVTQTNGKKLIVEGDKIVGQTPTLHPGQEFSYNSYHVVEMNAEATGAYYGVDEFNQPIHTHIPSFHLLLPSKN